MVELRFCKPAVVGPNPTVGFPNSLVGFELLTFGLERLVQERLNSAEPPEDHGALYLCKLRGKSKSSN